MKDVELYAKVRHAVRIDGLSKRAVARRFGIDPRTVDKMLEFSVPPGYRRSKPPVKPPSLASNGAHRQCTQAGAAAAFASAPSAASGVEKDASFVGH